MYIRKSHLRPQVPHPATASLAMTTLAQMKTHSITGKSENVTSSLFYQEGGINVSNPNITLAITPLTGLLPVYYLVEFVEQILGYTLIHTRFKQIADAPVSQHVDCLLSPRPQSAVSEWFLLFTKNHWTARRKCVQPERRVGNASIHLFVFHRKQFWRQSCKKMASPQLGNRDSQNKFARKLSKVCHSRDMRISEYNIYRWAHFWLRLG